MIRDREKIRELIDEMSVHIDRSTDIYLIGGGALMYHGAKLQTKDLDLIVVSDGEFDRVVSVMKKIGFSDILPTAGFENADVRAMMKRDDIRFDLFHTRVCRKLSLSESMIQRCKELYSNNFLHLYICDIGDIMIFKSITDREGDIDDCINLIKTGEIEWDVVLSEIKGQVSNGDHIWITYIDEKMHRIAQESNIEIPIMKELDKMNAAFIKEYLGIFDRNS